MADGPNIDLTSHQGTLMRGGGYPSEGAVGVAAGVLEAMSSALMVRAQLAHRTGAVLRGPRSGDVDGGLMRFPPSCS